MAQDNKAQLDRIEHLVDSLALATQKGFISLAERIDTRFDGVDRRLGNIETRVEDLETETRAFRLQAERRLTTLEARSD